MALRCRYGSNSKIESTEALARLSRHFNQSTVKRIHNIIDFFFRLMRSMFTFYSCFRSVFFFRNFNSPKTLFIHFMDLLIQFKSLEEISPRPIVRWLCVAAIIQTIRCCARDYFGRLKWKKKRLA